MFRYLLKLRYLAVIIVILAVLHALAFLFMGTQIAFRAYAQILKYGPTPVGESRPGLELLHSLDFLFVAIVFIVLALGLARLFVVRAGATNEGLPTWLHIEKIGDLKVMLWETILMTLVIVGLSELALLGPLTWEALVRPAAILILAVSLYLVKRH